MSHTPAPPAATQGRQADDVTARQIEDAWPVSLLHELVGPGQWEPATENLIRQVLSFGHDSDAGAVFIAACSVNALLETEIRLMRAQLRRNRQRLMALLHSHNPGERAQGQQVMAQMASVARFTLQTLLHEQAAHSALESYLARLRTLGYTLEATLQRPAGTAHAVHVARTQGQAGETTLQVHHAHQHVGF